MTTFTTKISFTQQTNLFQIKPTDSPSIAKKAFRNSKSFELCNSSLFCEKFTDITFKKLQINYLKQIEMLMKLLLILRVIIYLNHIFLWNFTDSTFKGTFR